MSSGIILESKGLSVSKQGLVLISISQVLKFSSIMKTKPKISKLFSRLFGSILPYTALIA